MESTTVSTPGLLSPEAAVALEALCFDDDDLCCMIADLGVYNAISRMSQLVDLVPPERDARIENALHDLRKKCIGEREQIAVKWAHYLRDEPPF